VKSIDPLSFYSLKIRPTLLRRLGGLFYDWSLRVLLIKLFLSTLTLLYLAVLIHPVHLFFCIAFRFDITRHPIKELLAKGKPCPLISVFSLRRELQYLSFVLSLLLGSMF